MKNFLNLMTKDHHRKITLKQGQRGGGYARFYKGGTARRAGRGRR